MQKRYIYIYINLPQYALPSQPSIVYYTTYYYLYKYSTFLFTSTVYNKIKCPPHNQSNHKNNKTNPTLTPSAQTSGSAIRNNSVFVHTTPYPIIPLPIPFPALIPSY